MSCAERVHPLIPPRALEQIGLIAKAGLLRLYTKAGFRVAGLSPIVHVSCIALQGLMYHRARTLGLSAGWILASCDAHTWWPTASLIRRLGATHVL